MGKATYNLQSRGLLKTQNLISVFLVEDDKTYLATLEYYLRKHFSRKIQVESFFTGEDCVKEIEKNPTTEVVLLDYYLYNESSKAMNGLETLMKIKEINPDVVVIMLSSEDKLEIAIDCISNGAYEYVVKSETAFIRIQNILKNLIQAVRLQSYFPRDIGGEG